MSVSHTCVKMGRVVLTLLPDMNVSVFQGIQGHSVTILPIRASVSPVLTQGDAAIRVCVAALTSSATAAGTTKHVRLSLVSTDQDVQHTLFRISATVRGLASRGRSVRRMRMSAP